MSKWFWTIFSLSAPDLATLLHDVATCVEWTGQTHATYRNRVAKCTQYVVTQQCCKMLRWNVASVWPGLKVRGSLLSFHVIETSSWNIWVVRPGRQLNMLLLIEAFFFNQQYNLIRQIASCVSCCYVALWLALQYPLHFYLVQIEDSLLFVWLHEVHCYWYYFVALQFFTITFFNFKTSAVVVAMEDYFA